MGCRGGFAVCSEGLGEPWLIFKAYILYNIPLLFVKNFKQLHIDFKVVICKLEVYFCLMVCMDMYMHIHCIWDMHVIKCKIHKMKHLHKTNCTQNSLR